MNQQILDHGLNRLESVQEGQEASELHHVLYNEDYFIIGTAKAIEFLDDYGTFNAIGKVQNYERENFGDITTDLTDPEKIAGMLAYVEGEEALGESETLREKWNDTLDADDLKAIKEELEALV